MTRKSRKHNNNIKSVSINNPSVSTASYVRLSVQDLKNKGDSIETQKKIILDYINNHSELRLFDFYIDDGISGTTFDRPDFKRMVEDIKQNKINMVLTKDLSRLGRNYVLTGQYTDFFFPENDVRYIAINEERVI